jgi:predicted nuclease with TOPRIM domain
MITNVRNLPPEIKERLIQSLSDIPDEYLIAAGENLMVGGFKKPKQIRDRIAVQVQGNTIPPWLWDLFHSYLPGRDAISVLSTAAIQYLLSRIQMILGRDELILALFFDEREEVQKLAVDQLTQPTDEPTEDDLRAAEQEFFGFIDMNVLASLHLELVDPQKGKDQASSEVLRVLTETCEKDGRLIERLKRAVVTQAQHAKEKTRTAVARVEKEKANLATRLAQSEAQVNRLTKEKTELETQLNSFEGEKAAAIARGVELQINSEIRKWLAAPRAVEKLLHETPDRSADLLARAETALQAQRREDMHSGNRAELEEKCAAFRQMRERLILAGHNAIHPVGQLADVREDIDTEIARLEQVLKRQQPRNELAEKLAAEIAAAAEWGELRDLSNLLETLAQRELIPVEDQRKIHHRLHAKFSLLQERAGPKVKEQGDNGWTLRGVLYRNEKAVLVLDGHNILFLLKDIFGPVYENDHPGQKARAKLNSLIVKLVGPRPNVKATIWYDGPVANRVSLSPNIEMAFSGGQGTDRADQRIAEYLEVKDLQDLGSKVFVVSDDRAVRRKAVTHGALYVRVSLFAVLVEDFKCL